METSARSRRWVGAWLSTATLVAFVAPAATARAQGPAAAKPTTANATTDASAEETAARVMTLSEAIAFARAHQPSVRAARARIAAAAASAAIPRAQWLPTLGATAEIFGASENNSTAMTLGDPAVDIPRIGGTKANASRSFRPYASTFVGVTATQEVFDFGRIAAETAAAEAKIEIERSRAEGSYLDLDLDVRRAYYAVRAAHAVLRAADGAYARAKAHRDLSAAGVKNGLRAPVELTREEADLARAEVGKVRAQGGLAVAESVLAAAIGSDEPAVDAAPTNEESAPLPTLDQALEAAARKDPALREALAILRAQEAHTKAIGAELRPNLSATATLSGRAGGAPPSGGAGVPYGQGLIPSIPNWDVGLVLSWPIADGVVSARKRASRAEEDALRAELDQTKVDALAAVRKAYFAAEIARKNLPALERAVDAAKQNEAEAEARFKAGLASAVELADAEALLAEAEVELALGRFESARSRAELARTMAEGS